MIIGNKKTFAIEYEIVNEFDSMLPGHFCYWIGGKQVGNFSLMTYLNDVLLFMPWIVHDIGDRKYAEHIDVDATNWDDIFEKIRLSIYEFEMFDDNPARFDISIKVEALLGITIFYIEDNKCGYILYKDSSLRVSEIPVKKGYVDQILLQSYKKFTDIFDSLQ